MPHSFTSKEKKPCASTQPVGDDLDLPALFLHGIVELQHDQIHTGIVSLLSQLAGDLGTSSIRISPVSGATTFSAAT